MPHRPLLLLFAAANFAIGLGAFVAVGVLSPIAADFGLAKADAGWVMTAYALAYAVGSPVLVALTGRIERKGLLTFALALFAAGAAGAAAAPSFAMLLVGRAVMAIGAGLMTPVAAAIAATLTPPEQRGKALALVFGGFTIAQAFGVPAGAWIGYAFGWRWAFVIVAALAIVASVLLSLNVPRGLKAPGGALTTLGETLRSPGHVVAVSLTIFAFASMYSVYTYLGPLAEQRYGLARDGVSLMFALFGFSAIIGNWLGGLLTDRIGPERTLTFVCLGMGVLLPLMTALDLPLLLMLIAIAAWSVIAFGFMSAQQARLVMLDPAKAPTLLALNAASIYLGGALGAYVGSATLKTFGFSALGLVGAGFALIALASMRLTRRLKTSA